jgi:hypothetical protein
MFPVREFDRCQFFALFGEDFDTGVIALEVQIAVRNLGDIEIDGGGAGGFGVGGHFQFFVGGLLELGAEEDWGGEDEEQEWKSADETTDSHGRGFYFKRDGRA